MPFQVPVVHLKLLQLWYRFVMDTCRGKGRLNTHHLLKTPLTLLYTFIYAEVNHIDYLWVDSASRRELHCNCVEWIWRERVLISPLSSIQYHLPPSLINQCQIQATLLSLVKHSEDPETTWKYVKVLRWIIEPSPFLMLTKFTWCVSPVGIGHARKLRKPNRWLPWAEHL